MHGFNWKQLITTINNNTHRVEEAVARDGTTGHNKLWILVAGVCFAGWQPAYPAMRF
jgi:hypothetical protein